MQLNLTTKLFVFLSGMFISCIVVAEIIGGKLFSLEETLKITKFSFSFLGEKNLSLTLSVGVLPWPIVFILTDIINDYYGIKAVRFLTYVSVVLISLSFLLISLSVNVSPDLSWWTYSQTQKGVPNMNLAFIAVFGQSLNIIFASIIAFLIGQLIDSLIFKKIKQQTGDKYIWLRATISTLGSQFIDSIAVTLIAFYVLSTMSFSMALALAFTAYIYKFIVALLCTPLLYVVHFLIETYLGKETATQMRKNSIANSLSIP